MSQAHQFPRFWPKPPWFGGDLQTLRNALGKERPGLTPWPGTSLHFPTADGSGDVLQGVLHRPDYSRERPLVILLHGLTGCIDSIYMLRTTETLLRRGWPVLRLNLRGAGASRSLCRRDYHAGASGDLRAVLRQMDGGLAAHGLVLVGFSLGGNIALKYLAEEGGRAPVLGAATVSAPIDLKAAQLRLMARRNRGYHDYLLARAKTCFLLSRAERAAIGTIYDFDELVTAPRNGFAGADDYYRGASAAPLLNEIRVRTLLISASNDPWIPSAAYRAIDPRANRRMTVLLPRGGGHVGFHGIGHPGTWHDRCIGLFLEGIAARR
jgi:predicted alpha/beta-fold hydrolase